MERTYESPVTWSSTRGRTWRDQTIVKIKLLTLSYQARLVINNPVEKEACTHISMMTDATRKPLHLPQEGLYEALERGGHT